MKFSLRSKHNKQWFFRQLSDDNGRRVMKSLLIAIPALLMVGFGAWAFLVLVVLEH